MPGHSHAGGRAAVVLAIALTITLSPNFARVVPAQAKTGIPAGQAAPAGGPARAGEQAAAPPAAAMAPQARIQPGGPLVASRDSGAVTFARSGPGIASTNWAGYAATRGHGMFRYVSAVFFVPYINCAATPDTYSAHWVGLDGESTSTVEQVGVLATCARSTPRYAAWYELFPQRPAYPHLAVSPGDSVRASIYYRRGTRKFTVALTDTTTGARFRTSLPCPSGATCARSSAEVISEAPSSSGRLLPLTDFGAITYSAIKIADDAGHRAGLRSPWWAYAPVTMVSRRGGAVADQPTELYRGSAFGNYWMRST